MIISAYISVNGFKGLRPGDAERLTHVNWAFAVVKEGRGSVDHWKNSDAVREFNKNKGHLKSVLSVGGWGAGGFSNACMTPEGRETLAQTLADISYDYGFDGIDMDWEYPGLPGGNIDYSPKDKYNYTELIRLLREKLGPDKVVSMAAGAMQDCIDNLELDKLLQYMDFINLMTYDMCPWNKVNYHTALFASDKIDNKNGDAAVKLFTDAGWPIERLTMGAAFYARNYKDVNGLGDTFPGPHPGWANYGSIVKKSQEAGIPIEYDGKAETAYVYIGREFFSFDNPRSLKAKVDYIRKRGLVGIMFWEYTCDDENSTLLKAIAEAKILSSQGYLP